MEIGKMKFAGQILPALYHNHGVTDPSWKAVED